MNHKKQLKLKMQRSFLKHFCRFFSSVIRFVTHDPDKHARTAQNGSMIEKVKYRIKEFLTFSITKQYK